MFDTLYLLVYVNDNFGLPYKCPRRFLQTFSIRYTLSHIARDLPRFCKRKGHWLRRNRIAERRRARYP